ncbi:MAG: large-conductance mechanosensitive channel protein MscL [Chromatiales bacterium]|nr:large-conductance mechanosensitive channel protein MscL [Chromatiales bacterium]
MSMLNEFREFAVKGNMVDMAVGIIIGTAFGQIINSLVNDMLMPPIGLLIGGVDFSDLALTLRVAEDGAEAVLLSYGAFINTAINFLIVAMAIFFAVKVINRLKREQEAAPEPQAPPAPSREQVLLEEIRDLLKK